MPSEGANDDDRRGEKFFYIVNENWNGKFGSKVQRQEWLLGFWFASKFIQFSATQIVFDLLPKLPRGIIKTLAGRVIKFW